jgi:hypothetical protein
MVPNQFFQLLLFLQHRPPVFYFGSPSPVVILVLLVLADNRIPHQPGNIVLLFFVILPLVARMIYSKQTAHDSCTTEVIHSKICAALVLIFQKGKSLALACFLVTD